MFRGETHRRLERALSRVLGDGATVSDAPDLSLAYPNVDLLAKSIADQLWREGYVLSPALQTSRASPPNGNAPIPD